MALQKIQLRPGIWREGTKYSNQGGWYDCDKIRFRSGLPEKMKGWTPNSTDGNGDAVSFTGTCRSLFSWNTLNGQNYIGLGTSSKFYVLFGSYFDITPIRKTVTLGSSSMACTNLLKTVVITDTANGANAGDYVTITGATTFGGIPAVDLNKEFSIDSVTVNTITITVATAATSTTTGGGMPTLAYQLSTGLDTVSAGEGWGAGGGWGWPATTSPSGDPIAAVGWGEAYSVEIISQSMRLWSQDNYGEDLIINPRGGAIYYDTLDQIEAGTRATNIVDLAGSNSCPVVAQEICVFGPASTVMAFACNPYSNLNQDPMTIRWSAAQNILDWQPRADNIAGELRLSAGSIFITKVETKQEVVVWTDTAVFSVRWVGYPDIFLSDQIGNGTSIMGPNAKAVVDDRVYWMGATAFYGYSGRIEQIPCSIKDYIFSRLNISQADMVTCGTNLALGEVIWFYPSGTSEVIDSYVTYNYLENIWYYGSLARTAWLDFGINGLPIATGEDHVLYNHEVGYDDGSTNPASPITAYIESSPFEIGDGDSFAFVRQIFPDLTFDNSTVSQPTATFTITGYNYPGSAATAGPPTGFNPDTAPITSIENEMNQFTQQLSLRLRARSVSMKLSSDGTGVSWRLGVPRFELRTDGRR
jgi:hypothetical protein